jgi:hypothetical protein
MTEGGRKEEGEVRRREEGESIDCKEREEVVLRLARSTRVWFYDMGGGRRREKEGEDQAVPSS